MNTSKEDEGYIDAQTATGKAPSGIAKAAENASAHARARLSRKTYLTRQNVYHT